MNTQKVGREVIKKLVLSGATWRTERLNQRQHVSMTLVKALLDDGMTQKEVANVIGVTQATISNSRMGRSTLSFGSIALLIDLVRQRKIKLPIKVKVWRPL
jgi:predicted XRE-type DNA-binding protein